MIKNMKEFAILIYKIIVYLLLSLIFFYLFSLRNIGLSNLSRTLVVTVSTFFIVLIFTTIIYGNFNVGKDKSKPIIYSSIISFIFIDIITYLQLMVMNTNSSNNPILKFEDLDLLVIVFILQCLTIVLLTYLGNYLYFEMFNPKLTTIVYDEEDSLIKASHFINRFKLQYNLINKLSINESGLLTNILNSEYVIFLEIEPSVRQELSKLCYMNNIDFSYAPSIMDTIESSAGSEYFDDRLFFSITANSLTIGQKIIKRVSDIILSLIGLIGTIPITLIIAVLIKLNDGGSIFFTQDRYTKDSKIFKVYKFRTMKENVENYSSCQEDERITSPGKIIRKLRLDEIPQLLNILKGDMSVVGPRPEMVENVKEYESQLPEFDQRLKVKAGLTGLAQIEGKYNTSPHDKLLMDLSYITNYSLWLDIKLIFKTVIVFIKSDSTEGFSLGE